MKLTNEKLIELKNILRDTPLTNYKESQLLKARAPGAYDSKRYYEMNSTNYTLSHNSLNEFLYEITNWDSKYLTSIHAINYKQGDKVKEHLDYSDLTCVIMLDNNSEGGDFLFNKEKINFKETGEYLLYNGGETLHEVTEIISGNRDVLVVWYRKDIKINKDII